MKVDIERQGNYVAAKVDFADFSTTGKGQNWQAALLDALARVEVEMTMRLYHARVLLPKDKKHKIEEPSIKHEETDKQERWFGLELINGQVVGENLEKKVKDGQAPCAVCNIPTWGTLCACCMEFASVDWKKQTVTFRPQAKDPWTKIKCVD